MIHQPTVYSKQARPGAQTWPLHQCLLMPSPSLLALSLSACISEPASWASPHLQLPPVTLAGPQPPMIIHSLDGFIEGQVNFRKYASACGYSQMKPKPGGLGSQTFRSCSKWRVNWNNNLLFISNEIQQYKLSWLHQFSFRAQSPSDWLALEAPHLRCTLHPQIVPSKEARVQSGTRWRVESRENQVYRNHFRWAFRISRRPPRIRWVCSSAAQVVFFICISLAYRNSKYSRAQAGQYYDGDGQAGQQGIAAILLVTVLSIYFIDLFIDQNVLLPIYINLHRRMRRRQPSSGPNGLRQAEGRAEWELIIKSRVQPLNFISYFFKLFTYLIIRQVQHRQSSSFDLSPSFSHSPIPYFSPGAFNVFFSQKSREYLSLHSFQLFQFSKQPPNTISFAADPAPPRNRHEVCNHLTNFLQPNSFSQLIDRSNMRLWACLMLSQPTSRLLSMIEMKIVRSFSQVFCLNFLFCVDAGSLKHVVVVEMLTQYFEWSFNQPSLYLLFFCKLLPH